MKIHIEDSWNEKLEAEFEKKYFIELVAFLRKQLDEGKTIYPNGKNVLNAFNLTHFNQVKVVILGQDPYHNAGQAHGLSFSVPDGVTKPPSLVNIFKELSSDMNLTIPESGNLEKWARQGVLLLNASLTVEENKPMSHSKIGWHVFTNNVIKTLSDNHTDLVFILWGKFAQSKEMFIDKTKHFIIKSVHPSPLSSYNGFFGSKPFSKTNEYLISKNIKPIDWNLI
jgi:uracil-DNA glycosylase